MARFIIDGRRKLGGEFRPAGNKNAVLPMLAACLLTDEALELRRVPHIGDVATMLEILAGLGVRVSRTEGAVRLCAKGIRRRRLPRELCHRVRSSILFAGPLAARHGCAVVYPPGGDVIGRRRLDAHLAGLRALGIECSGTDPFTFRRGRLRGAEILLQEASVTGTENLMMAAVLAPGRTTLLHAACEPHVRDLGELLVKMGARISGLGTNRIDIDGVEALQGAAHDVAPDHIEIGSFLAAAAVTGGDLFIPGVDEGLLRPILRPFQTLGLDLAPAEGGLRLTGRRLLRVTAEPGVRVPTIEDAPWPGFPSDLMSVALVAATQAHGPVLFFEKLFESRMVFVDRLLDMGARLVPCDPHRVVVIGPSSLRAVSLHSPDIRAGMALVIAALCARGTSVIANAEVIDRGYERLEERLQALGGAIAREA